MIYLQLFISFLKIGAFSFGGGYAAMPLIQAEVVNNHGWLSIGEFSDLITISQMTPGPIAINSATFVGTKIAGVWGSVVATLGCILPSCIIIIVLTYFYMKYRNLDIMKRILRTLRPAVVAMIATAGLAILISSLWNGQSIALSHFQVVSFFLFLMGIYLIMKKDLNMIFVIVLCGVINVVIHIII